MVSFTKSGPSMSFLCVNSFNNAIYHNQKEIFLVVYTKRRKDDLYF